MSEPLSDPFQGLGPAGIHLLGVGGQDMPVTYDEVPEAMDAWAHELAEKIRQEIRQFKADGVLGPNEDWAASDAADLIDPESDCE